MLDEASERLLKASAVIATEPERVPTRILLIKRRALQIIPTTLENFP